jgi:hypothetical protein
MAKDLYVYDVFDVDTDSYILENAPMGRVTETLKTDSTRVINAVKYGQKIEKRYIITRTYLDGTKNLEDAEATIVVPEYLQKEWDRVRFILNPKARVTK